MPGLTENEKRAFTHLMAEILQDNLTRLASLGFNGNARLMELRAKEQIAQDKEAAQLAARVAHENATAVSVKATDEAYKLASDTVEVIVGLVGKDDALANRLRNLRDEMNLEAARGPETEGEPA